LWTDSDLQKYSLAYGDTRLKTWTNPFIQHALHLQDLEKIYLEKEKGAL
jgi:hypothetical protein